MGLDSEESSGENLEEAAKKIDEKIKNNDASIFSASKVVDNWRGPSPGRFAWMLVPKDSAKSSDWLPDKKAPSADEFEAACEFALASWQALPIIAPNLFRWGKARNQKSKSAGRVRDRLTSILAFGRVTRQISGRFFAKLDQQRIPYAAIKASALQQATYTAPDLRIGKDIDIAVPMEYLNLAEEAAVKIGFVPAQYNEKLKRFHLADPIHRKAIEHNHYELGFLARRQIVHGLSENEQAAIRRDMPHNYLWQNSTTGELECYTCVDIHHGLSMDISSDPVVDSRYRVETADISSGLAYWVAAPEWLMLHTIYKIYWEGVHTFNKGGYQFADLAAEVATAKPGTLMRLFDLLEDYTLEAAGFYVFRRIETDLHTPLPPEIHTFLELTATISNRHDAVPMNDLGDMWPKLWGHR